jgi:hypothetical protein
VLGQIRQINKTFHSIEEELMLIRKQKTDKLKGINKRLNDIRTEEKSIHPYTILAKKFEKELGVKVDVTSRVITGELQKMRIRLMEYLIVHGYTKGNQISYQDVIKAMNWENLSNILSRESSCGYSPLHGGLKLNGYHTSKRFVITDLYIEPIKTAKTYVSLMRELVGLPIISQ